MTRLICFLFGHDVRLCSWAHIHEGSPFICNRCRQHFDDPHGRWKAKP